MRSIRFFLCLSMLYTGAAASAQEAYVYDNTAQGTYAYDASGTGKLTLIKGSPFQTVGQMIGTNGKFFVTADATFVFSYVVESNGSIGKQVSSINTQLYSGNECGTIQAGSGGGELDHTGANIYIPLAVDQDPPDDETCNSVQTYAISKTGVLTFKGATEFNQEAGLEYGVNSGLPTITGNGKFAYNFTTAAGFDSVSCYGLSLNGFAVEQDGVLLSGGGRLDLPAPPPGLGSTWGITGNITDDPTDHVAMGVYSIMAYPDCEGEDVIYGPPQLASATVDSQGNVTSTNSYENMPTLAGDGSPSSMVLDHTGKILAVATGTGIQLFHFNGAKPITAFTGVIGVSGSITHMSWDSDDHLYAQNAAHGKMHVYKSVKTGLEELSGSGTVIPQGQFVVRTK